MGVLIAANIVFPNFLLAQNPKQQSAFCSRLSEFALKIDQRLANREQKLEEKRTEISNRLKDRWDKRDVQLEKKLDKWEANRVKHYAKLAEKAKTEEQKKALNTFENTIEAAVAKRTSEVNTAMENFQQGIEQALISRRSSVDEIVSDFKDSVKAVFEQAKADCTADKDIKTIRDGVLTGLKSAREKFTADRQAIEKLGPTMSQLVTTRNQAIQKAFEDFRTAVKEARDNLKAAFQQ